LPLRLRLRLAPGVDRIEVEVDLDNTACDHRLRLLVGAPFAARRFEVESAFEVAERPIDPPRDAHGSAHPSELPIGATPQRGFATLCGDAHSLTVASRGGGEVEALPGGPGEAALALTLQVPGPHHLEFALRLHATGDPRRSAEAHRFAFPCLAFPVDGGGDAPLRDGDRLLHLDDPEVVVSAVEPRADGSTILRLPGARSSASPCRQRGARTSSISPSAPRTRPRCSRPRPGARAVSNST
jgi:alpha-mannosidase